MCKKAHARRAQLLFRHDLDLGGAELRHVDRPGYWIRSDSCRKTSAEGHGRDDCVRASIHFEYLISLPICYENQVGELAEAGSFAMA